MMKKSIAKSRPRVRAKPSLVSKKRKMAKKRVVRKALPAKKKVVRTQAKRKKMGGRADSTESVDVVAAREKNAEAIRSVLKESMFSEYISKTVGRQANEILWALATQPETDDGLVQKLNLKLNEVRRMLNFLNGYGVVRYNTNKDKKGWLTFEWYLDSSVLLGFSAELSARLLAGRERLPEKCNDFFVCGSCYDKQHIVFPFDVAYEAGFKCSCGRRFEMVSRADAEASIQK